MNFLDFLSAGLPIGGALAQGSAAGIQRRGEMDQLYQDMELRRNQQQMDREQAQARLAEMNQLMGIRTAAEGRASEGYAYGVKRRPVQEQIEDFEAAVADPDEQAAYEEGIGTQAGSTPLPRKRALNYLEGASRAKAAAASREKIAATRAASQTRSAQIRKDVAVIVESEKSYQNELDRISQEKRALFSERGTGMSDEEQIQKDYDRLDEDEKTLRAAYAQRGGRRLEGVADAQAGAFGVRPDGGMTPSPAPAPMTSGTGGAPTATGGGRTRAEYEEANRIRATMGRPPLAIPPGL